MIVVMGLLMCVSPLAATSMLSALLYDNPDFFSKRQVEGTAFGHLLVNYGDVEGCDELEPLSQVYTYFMQNASPRNPI